MKKEIVYTLSALTALTILSGFSSGGFFPAPIKEPAAAVYLNFSSSGIFEDNEESAVACEEIANTVNNIFKTRNISSHDELISERYKTISLQFLKDSIISGFLKIEELYFYYKNQDNYALIAKGDFNMDTIAAKTGANMFYDSDDKLCKVSVAINDNLSTNMFLQSTSNTLVISPKNIADETMRNLEENNNKLGENFKTFEKMLTIDPAISAEIDLEKLFDGQKADNLPKAIAEADVIRLVVSARQNKFQISIPEEENRESIKQQLLNQTGALNAIFDNKTDYQLKEGKTSIFIESKANKEQMQSISRKAMAFMLHFFIKNISSDQPKKDS